MQMDIWKAGNIARSRLSGGSCSVSARPGELIWQRSQPGLHRILLNVSPNAIELVAVSDQAIKAFFLPKRPVRAQQKIGLVTGEALERTQPLGGKHMRRN